MGKKDKELEEIRESKEHFAIACRLASKMLGSIIDEDIKPYELMFALELMISKLLSNSGASKAKIEKMIDEAPQRLRDCMEIHNEIYGIIKNKAS